jgi:hypothetical protein
LHRKSDRWRQPDSNRKHQPCFDSRSGIGARSPVLGDYSSCALFSLNESV